MSNYVLPALPGLILTEVERRTIFAPVSTFTTVSGKEQRVSWESTPRYEFKLKYELLREGVILSSGSFSGQSEVAAIHSLFESSKGGFDSWLMTDLYTGAQVRVRFLEDSLATRKVADGIWEADFKAITVK